jgi:hypothetical protein
LQQRLRKHNEGASIHTAKYRPWRLVAYFSGTNVKHANSNPTLRPDQARRLPTSASGDRRFRTER